MPGGHGQEALADFDGLVVVQQMDSHGGVPLGGELLDGELHAKFQGDFVGDAAAAFELAVDGHVDLVSGIAIGLSPGRNSHTGGVDEFLDALTSVRLAGRERIRDVHDVLSAERLRISQRMCSALV